MQPNSALQIKLGLGLCLSALIGILILALVPDPFFRQHLYVTQLDDVNGIKPGTKIDFHGAMLGEVRDVYLDPQTQRFTVKLGISRAWRAGSCAQVSVNAANPLSPARFSLDTLAAPAGERCDAARLAVGCASLALRPGLGDRPLVACRRAPDLVQSIAAAVAEATGVARSANLLVAQLQQGVGGTGGKRSDGGMMTDVAATLSTVRGLSDHVERNLRPGKGDLAVTLANLRHFSGNAASADVASVNAMLRDVRQLITQNQANVTALLSEGAGTTTQVKSTLEATSASLVRATANLEKISANLDALTERAAADPSSVLRGQRYADPPLPGARP